MRDCPAQPWRKRSSRPWLTDRGTSFRTTANGCGREEHNNHSAVTHQHKNLMDILRLMHFRDELDISALAGGELLVRWAVQTEIAVSRNPRHPDYSGLDIVFAAPTSAGDKAETVQFTEWVASKMKDRAAVFKHEHQYREHEAKARAVSSASGGDNAGGGGGGAAARRRGSKGGTGKGDKSGSSGASPAAA